MNTPPLIAVRANDVCFLGIPCNCGIAGISVVLVVYDWPGAGFRPGRGLVRRFCAGPRGPRAYRFR